MRVVMN